MATSIEVNKQSVKQLLETGKVKKFVIPEYQRTYAWDEDQVKTLFEDLVEFTEKMGSPENNEPSTYFLGTVVAFDNENNEQEIIDGQQRITSLFLLLRALYSKLCSMKETDKSKNFRAQIESSLWEQDELTAKVDFSHSLIYSKVMSDEGNETFSNILEFGTVDEQKKDNYSLNYKLFSELIENYATSEPELFYWFIRNVLNKAILLPITADSQETALTIFSTLNDRGLALSDADIFKAKMYNALNQENKREFIESWQNLTEEAEETGENIQKLFYYYMFYLRALDGDRNTTTPGLRKYYSNNKFERLHKKNVLEDLDIIVNLWRVVNNQIELLDEPWSFNNDILQVIDSLKSYPNEFWKYPVVTYYLKYRESKDFESQFLIFLRRLFSVLAARYVLTPTLNAVKRGILNLNAEIISSPNPKFDFSEVDEKELKNNLKTAHRNTVRMLLKVLSYQYQTELLPDKWEIEHIFPQKWHTTYFPNNTKAEVDELIDHIGNKIPFEKKLNIVASNGYFTKKKEIYEKSKIKLLQKLANENEKWGLEEIRERDIRISDELFSLLIEWGLNKTDGIENGSVIIPENRRDDYKKYIDLFHMKDTDESRTKFLSNI